LKRVFDCLLADDFSTAVRVLAFTGLRRDEVGGLRWSEVDLDAGMLNIPGTRTKNKRALTLTLPEPVLDILRAIPRRDAPCVFGDPQAGFRSWSHHRSYWTHVSPLPAHRCRHGRCTICGGRFGPGSAG